MGGGYQFAVEFACLWQGCSKKRRSIADDELGQEDQQFTTGSLLHIVDHNTAASSILGNISPCWRVCASTRYLVLIAHEHIPPKTTMLTYPTGWDSKFKQSLYLFQYVCMWAAKALSSRLCPLLTDAINTTILYAGSFILAAQYTSTFYFQQTSSPFNKSSTN